MPSEHRLPISPKDGPFLLAALLCERVLLEPDGVASAIRIVDQLVPDEALLKGAVVVPPVMQLSLLVILKSGTAPGGADLHPQPDRRVLRLTQSEGR